MSMTGRRRPSKDGHVCRAQCSAGPKRSKKCDFGAHAARQVSTEFRRASSPFGNARERCARADLRFKFAKSPCDGNIGESGNPAG